MSWWLAFVESRNVDLTCVTSAIDAATAALSLDFDLILLDLECPDYDAFLVTKRAAPGRLPGADGRDGGRDRAAAAR